MFQRIRRFFRKLFRGRKTEIEYTVPDTLKPLELRETQIRQQASERGIQIEPYLHQALIEQRTEEAKERLARQQFLPEPKTRRRHIPRRRRSSHRDVPKRAFRGPPKTAFEKRMYRKNAKLEED